MTTQSTRDVVLQTLTSIAPEVDPDDLEFDTPLRTQVDLDSMDWLNFLVGLHRTTGVEIPEAEYSKLRTLDDIIGYLGQLTT